MPIPLYSYQPPVQETYPTPQTPNPGLPMLEDDSDSDTVMGEVIDVMSVDETNTLHEDASALVLRAQNNLRLHERIYNILSGYGLVAAVWYEEFRIDIGLVPVVRIVVREPASAPAPDTASTADVDVDVYRDLQTAILSALDAHGLDDFYIAIDPEEQEQQEPREGIAGRNRGALASSRGSHPSADRRP